MRYNIRMLELCKDSGAHMRPNHEYGVALGQCVPNTLWTLNPNSHCIPGAAANCNVL